MTDRATTLVQVAVLERALQTGSTVCIFREAERLLADERVAGPILVLAAADVEIREAEKATLAYLIAAGVLV